MTAPAALELIDVERRYGEFVAVHDVSFTIHAGEIVTLLGPNGAGKTTTVKMASTLLTPTRGEVRVRGIDAVRQARRARAHLGLALGGDRGFYMRASVMDNMRFFAEIKAVHGKALATHILDTLDRVGLRDRATSKVEQLSRGMRQRLHIARALLGDPAVVLLDEPSSGLDPENARELRRLVAELRTAGVAVLLTSHDMAEAEELADRILVLDRGVVAVTGTTADVAAAAGIAAVSTFRSLGAAPTSVHEAIARLPHVADILADRRNGATTLDVMWSEAHPDTAVVEHLLGTGSEHLITRVPTLEEAYLAFLARRGAESAHL